MTDKQYMRMQHLMLKDEVQKLTQSEHDELFALLELAEAEENASTTEIRDLTDLFYLFPDEPTQKEVNPNDQSKAIFNPCIHRYA